MHELVALASALSRWHLRARSGVTRFVGREMEVEFLAHLGRHVREGRGQVAVLTAEPGVGKSRLAHEFLARAAAEGWQIAEAGALELDRYVAHAAVKRLLRSALAISEGEDAEVSGDRLARALERYGADPSCETPLAFALNLPLYDQEWESLPSEGRARRVTEAVRELVGRMAQAAPLMLLVEDPHWIDRESRAVIGRLISRRASSGWPRMSGCCCKPLR